MEFLFFILIVAAAARAWKKWVRRQQDGPFINVRWSNELTAPLSIPALRAVLAHCLAERGCALVDTGEGFDLYHKQVREMFDKVQMRKPLSSRDRSREQYLLARGFRGV